MRGRIVIILCMCCVVVSACTRTYNQIMTEAVRDAIGESFDGYESFSYPVDNYGLITSYEAKGKDAATHDEMFICDTWACLGRAGNEPENPDSLLTIMEFAAVGSGGIITLNEKTEKDLAFNGLLPELFQTIDVSGGFNKKSVTTVSLSMGPAHWRKLRRQPMVDYMESLPDDQILKRTYERGDLILVVADVVVAYMKVDVTVDSKTSTELDAKFDPSLPRVVSFEGAKLDVQMSSSKSGQYTFEVNKPVIVFLLTKKQPMGGTLEGDEGWDDWSAVKVPLPELKE